MPTLKGNYDTFGQVGAAEVVGNYAYLAGYTGLQIIDISNSNLIGLLDYIFLGDVYDLQIVGNYAYVGNNAGLTIIDISDPTLPTLKGNYDTFGYARGVEVVGNYAYVAAEYQLLIIDISDPTTPTLKGNNNNTSAYDVQIVDDFAYVADANLGLLIFDISDPAFPSLKSNFDTGSASNVDVVGNYAYVADGLGLQIIDVSNPITPTLKSNYHPSDSSLGVQLVGNYAYVADNSSGLQIIDISNPATPTLKGNYDTSGEAEDVKVVGNYAYIADGTSGLQIIDISNPTTPTLKGSYDTSHYARGVDVVGNYAYVAALNSGLQIIDISNPTTPYLKGSYDTLGAAWRVEVVDNYAYVADQSGLRIIDISNPTTPTLKGSTDAGYALRVQIVGSYAYVAANYAGLAIVDISNPSRPTLKGYYYSPDTPFEAAYDAQILGNYAYAAYGVGGLKIIDVSEFTNPQTVTLTVSPASVSEDGSTNLVYTFTRTGNTVNLLNVNYTVGGTATFNTDYAQSGAASFNATTGTVTFAVGSDTATVTIDPTADTIVEPDETIALTLNSGTGYTVGTISAVTGTINNDDFPQVSVTAIANGNEANGSPAIFRFSRTGSTTDPLSVSYRLLGTAQAGSDYTGPTTGSISFSAGIAIAELSLPALADSVVDPGDTIIAQIVPSTAATPGYLITPGQQTATATITAEGMVVTGKGQRWSGWSMGSRGEVMNAQAFAALKSDGTVVSWGDSGFGGTTPAGLSGVTQIFSNYAAFAALKSDGTVVSWGYPDYGGTTPAGLGGVTQIFSTERAFAALKSDGTVVTWGYDLAGGTAPAGLSGVTQIFSNYAAFAALKSDGTVVSWGDANYGGTAPAGLSGVVGFANPFTDDRLLLPQPPLPTLEAPTIDPLTGDDFLTVSEYENGLLISGSGRPGAIVTVAFEDSLLPSFGGDSPPSYNVSVGSDGQWVLALSAAQVGLLGVGDDMVIATQSWPASDVVSEAAYRLFYIEGAPAPSIAAISGDDLITIAEALAGFTIQGTGVPGATILLAFSSGSSAEAGATTVVDLEGNWSLSITPQDVYGFGEGDESIEVSQQLSGTGFTSGVSNRSFAIEPAPAPNVDVIAADDILSPEESQLGFSITGSGVPGATIIILFASGVTPEAGSSAEVDPTGRWSLLVSPSDLARIGPINESIDVYQVITQLGLTSSGVSHDFLIEDAPAPTIDAITGDDSISASDLRSGFVISGRGLSGSTIHLEFDSGTVLESGPTALVGTDGSWSVAVVQADVIGFDLGPETILISQTIPGVGFTSGVVSHIFTVEAINLPPTGVVLNNTVTSLEENSSTLAAIKLADIAISDDALGSNAITLDGDDAAFFEVVGTGLFLKAGTSLNYEAKASYAVTVSVSDTTVAGSVPVTASYGLAITDVNEAPTAVVLSNAVSSLEENSSTLAAIKLADIAISDDALGSNTISLAGADAAFFEVVGSSLFLKAGTSLNYEAKASYGVTVSVSDPTVAGSVPVTASYALGITDVNEAPTAVVLTNAVSSLGENIPTLAAIKVADIAISDDALGSNAITLDGDDAAFFEVVGTGLFLKAGTSLNYEAKASYAVTVSVSDTTVAGSVPVTASYGLAITDVNEAPTAVVLSNAVSSLEENSSTLAAIKLADIAISDDALGGNTISLDGADAAFFEVVGSGLYLKAGTSLNYETKASYGVTVSVSDPTVAGSVPVTASYALAVRDLNEAPTALNLSATAFDENIAAGSQVALLSANDPDSTPQSFSYALVSGTGSTHNLFFSLAGNALRITRSPDYETRSSYSIRLRATDQGGLSVDRSVLLNVNDLPDSPTYSFSKSADFVYERGAFAIGVSTTNVSAGTRIYWSFSGTNITAGDFTDGQLLGSVSLGDDGRASLTKVVAADGINEADETLEVKFFSDAARSQQIGTTLSITLKEPVVGVVSDGPDIITGTSANEVITGVPTSSILRGRGTVDRLTGGGGNDQFSLGDRNGAYYNDGDPATDGSADIAVITDFNAGDSIALFGSASLYQLSRGSYSSTAGLWIQMLPAPGGLSERIGFVQGATLSTLSLSNTSQLTYLN